MSTPIQPVPDVVLASPFPTLADRPAGTYNQKAKDWADSENAMSVRNREIALVGHNNATTATEQAGIAVTKANEASNSAQTATNKAQEAAESAQNLADLDALWLGAATSDPATGKGGAPLVAGNAYVNSVTGYLRAYNGSAWVQGVSAVAGVSSLNGQIGALVLKTLGGQSLLGAGDLDVKQSVVRVARTSNTQLQSADNGRLIDITSGTFTQTFAAAAALDDGWYCYLKNSGTGDITLDPNEAETIDGMVSYIMYPGEVRLIQCDGAALRSIVLNGFKKTYIASGSFVKPPGYAAFAGHLWGGGASGSKSNGSVDGGPGGGCAPFNISSDAVPPGVSAVVIGSGGAAVTANSTDGISGGDSSFLGIQAYGGKNVSGALTAGSALRNTRVSIDDTTRGADPYSGQMSVKGSDNGNIDAIFAGSLGARTDNRHGANSVYGGAGGGGFAAILRTPGVSVFGGDGGAAGETTSGMDGEAPGGGGGGTLTGPRSGAGARGELRIWGII